MVPSGDLGFLTVWPDGETQPAVSTLNAEDGEITSNMAIVQNLDGETDAGQFAQLAELLYDQAALAEGGQLANPAEYVQRLNRLLVRLAGVHEAAASSA